MQNTMRPLPRSPCRPHQSCIPPSFNKVPSHRHKSISTFPRKTWDSHTHVCDPKAFPFAKQAQYTPHAAKLSELQSLHQKLQIPEPNIVLVQPSTYGLDNSCLLSALDELTPKRGRGVVAIDPAAITGKMLRQWHRQGVRGVRVNLKSVGASPKPEELKSLLKSHAEVIRPMETWVLQIYADMAYMPIISEVLPELGVKVCVDHFGCPPPMVKRQNGGLLDPSELEGWDALMQMMRSEEFFVKVSATYRISVPQGWKDIDVLAKGLLTTRSGRGVVWASDWPHTRFEGVDLGPFMAKCLEWCEGGSELKEKLFRTNAEELWDVQD